MMLRILKELPEQRQAEQEMSRAAEEENSRRELVVYATAVVFDERLYEMSMRSKTNPYPSSPNKRKITTA